MNMPKFGKLIPDRAEIESHYLKATYNAYQILGVYTITTF